MTADNNILYWIINDVLAFAIALGVSAMLLPKIMKIAYRRELFDQISERKLHKVNIPRLGGLCFFPSYLFALIILSAVGLRTGSIFMEHAVKDSIIPVYFEIGSIIVMYLVGIADDLVGVRYKTKFIAQIGAAVIMLCSGLSINNLHGLLWLHELPVWLGWAVTVFAVIFVVNAINLIDGIDGLASGLSFLALCYYSGVFLHGDRFVYSMVAVAVAGTLIPFFYYNVYGNAERRKKIFMGDTGALTTGMVIVFCAVVIMGRKPDSVVTDYNPAVVAIAPLIIPCFDVCRVYLHRVRRGRNPFLPDKAHIHHKLLALGMTQSYALVAILLASLLFTVVNILLSSVVNPNLLLVGDVVVYSVANIFLTRSIRARERRLGLTLFE